MLYKKVVTSSVSIVLTSILAVGFAAMRGFGTIGPAHLRWLLPLSFCLMTLLPWILLTANGRTEIDLRKPIKYSSLGWAIMLGAAAALMCFLLNSLLFGKSQDNAFIKTLALLTAPE